MKFAFALISAISAAQAFNLRGFFENDSATKTIEAQVKVDYETFEGISADDVKHIGDHVLSALNNAGLLATKMKTQPVAVFDQSFSGGCKGCPPDDDAAFADTALFTFSFDLDGDYLVDASRMAKVTSNFEANYCSKLASLPKTSDAGSSTKVNGCGIFFLDTNAMDASHEIQVTLKGAHEEIGAPDTKIIQEVLADAYNNVYTGLSKAYFLVAAAAPAEPVEGGCKGCPPDDDSLLDSIETAQVIIASKQVLDETQALLHGTRHIDEDSRWVCVRDSSHAGGAEYFGHLDTLEIRHLVPPGEGVCAVVETHCPEEEFPYRAPYLLAEAGLGGHGARPSGARVPRSLSSRIRGWPTPK